MTIQVHCLHGSHSGHAVRFQHVGGDDGAQISAVFGGKVQGRSACVHAVRQCRDLNAQFLHEPSVAAEELLAFDNAGHALAGDGLKFFRLG